ncbi:MAG: hypothetical protein NT126_03100 [Bacteroidetes bacterium]|nr:hypothetical protein [Bacteroidota bacterium]
MDYRNYLQAFDNGVFRQLEYLPVKSFRAGGAAIAYIDNTNEFRIYSDEQKFDMTFGGNLSYFMTDYLVAYRVGNVLSVFEKQHSLNLSYYCSIYSISDSLIGFFDESNYNFSVYYKGNVTDLESSMMEPPKKIKTGSNTLAYVNQSNYFKVFYRGKTYLLDDIAPVRFEAGRDLVAYIDDYNRYFHLFYKGDTARIETFAPDSFKLGFGIMAYVDNLGNFRVFSDGATRRLLSAPPDFFKVKGNTLVYASNNNFNVFYKGEIFLLEDFIPQDFQVGNDGVAYIDVSGRLKLFQEGKTHTVSYEVINKYQLNGNVLTYSVGTNTTNFFWNGKNY